MAKRWYVVHAYSGFEQQVKRSLEERIHAAEKDLVAARHEVQAAEEEIRSLAFFDPLMAFP